MSAGVLRGGRRCFLPIILILLCIPRCSRNGQQPNPEDEFRALRLSMVETQIAARGITDTAVLRAMRSIPRHRFVPREQADNAYEDRPLPIGEGQTISQPYIVALMTQLIKPQMHHRVLEVGTGSGYQAAVLSCIVDSVFTIEILRPLEKTAAARLSALGYRNVVCQCGDGYLGWPDRAPFDGIIVTAAVNHIPKPLLHQLKDGGRLAIPLGEPGGVQQLLLLEKRGDKVAIEEVTPVSFVPLTRNP